MQVQTNGGMKVININVKLKLLIVILIILTASCKEYEKFKFYHCDSNPVKTFENNLQIADIMALGEEKRPISGLFLTITRNTVNKVWFTIQGDNGPLQKNTDIEIYRVVLESSSERVESSSSKKKFSSVWSFAYTNKIKPDFLDPSIHVYSWSYDPVNKTTIGSLNTGDENLGSYFYVFYFDQELKETDQFQIKIYYSLGDNLEEKELIVNAEFSGYLERAVKAPSR